MEQNINNLIDNGQDLTNVSDNSQFCRHQTCLSVHFAQNKYLLNRIMKPADILGKIHIILNLAFFVVDEMPLFNTMKFQTMN